MTNDVSYCNSCIDIDDPRYDEAEGCIDGQDYGFCSHERCGGMCESLGRCRCACHGLDT
jgi:hypothetical protein